MYVSMAKVKWPKERQKKAQIAKWLDPHAHI